MGNLEELQKKVEQYEMENTEFQLRIEELSDYIENAAIPLHWVNADGIIIWANQAELDLLGYSKDEYIGFPIANFHFHAHVIQDILVRLSKNETLHNYHAQLKTKNGDIKHVLISSNVFRKNGEFIHTRCFTRDITPLIEERTRNAELLKALEQNSEKLRMAIEATNIGTWDWDPASNDLYWSNETRNIYGIAMGAQIGFDAFFACIHPDDKVRMQTAIDHALKATHEGDYDIVHRIIRQDDKQTRWLRGQGKVYFDGHGNAERFIGTVFDITEAKQAEERSARLAAIIESSYDAVISKTLDGIVTSWNDSAERIFGYTAKEMIGEPILKIFPDNRKEEEDEILSRLRKGERVEDFETQRLTKAGKLIDVSLTISPITESGGNIIGLSKIARDISEKKQEEQRKNSFIAVVSHELKTPLTSIKAYIQILLERAKLKEDKFGVDVLLRSENQAKKMIAMIHDFLSLARIEDGKIHLNIVAFELKSLIEEIIADAQILTDNHTIALTGTDRILVEGDREKIGHVLLNLIGNAIKYSPNGGTIMIGCERKEGKVCISVKDNGIGISPSDQKRLFERFYRVNNQTAAYVSGFGIGLYLVSEILRLHNSRIEVESSEGKGSTFSFNLNIATL